MENPQCEYEILEVLIGQIKASHIIGHYDSVLE